MGADDRHQTVYPDCMDRQTGFSGCPPMPTDNSPTNRLRSDHSPTIRVSAAIIFAAGWLGSTAGSPQAATGQAIAAAQATPSKQVLVTVNGKPITRGDLDFLLLTRGVPQQLRPKLQKQFLNRLVDRRLVQEFLDARKLKASPLLIDAHLERIKRFIRKNGDDPKTVFARLGYSEQTLRRELALPLTWRAYVTRTATLQRLRDEFAAHHQEFDGTQVRASQIFLKLPADAKPPEIQSARDNLAQARADILAKRITFAAAAKQFSQAPSRNEGGDVGFFPYQGKMPAEFSRRAFALKVGEISQPFRSRFGMHLVTVTARKPGRLSLEDVRNKVLDRITSQEWTKLVQTQRKTAKIIWHTGK